MKSLMPMLLGAALIVGCAAPALASQQQYQSDQDRDRDRNTQAYNDGYAQGQADARGHAIRNNRPSAQWTKDDDQRAYGQGYDAGYSNILNGRTDNAVGATPEANLGSGDQQARQFGYQDGVAAGRKDQMEGHGFKPDDHELYKQGTHGWTTTLGTKDQFKRFYREGFVKGYEEGYRGPGQR